MNSISANGARAASLVAALGMAWIVPAAAGEYSLPVDCESAGVECLVQQYADMDEGPDAVDPYCGPKTYDGHTGTDIRVPSLADIAKGVPVLAVADGVILRLRDGMENRLAASEADIAALAGRECGNGLIARFGDHEVQYCHLREGSITLQPGDTVKAGDRIAEIGASGLAQFPHLEIVFRQAGQVIEPMSGKPPGAACSRNLEASDSLWGEDAFATLKAMDRPLVAAGVSGTVPDHDRLSIDGPPRTARAFADDVTVGWAWFVNLRKGDRIRLSLRLPGGAVMAESVSDPLETNKADYSVYTGRKQPPQPGTYTLEVALLRDGRTEFETKKIVTVRE